MILYTSGTTGLPKGVVLTNANYRTFLEAATEVDGFAYGEDETVMIVMPLFHVAGTNVSFSGLAQGGRLVLVKDFTAADAVRMMREEIFGPVAPLFSFTNEDEAVRMANAYPDTPLLLHHWGSVDAPDFSPFNGNPDILADLVTNPERIHLLAPGQPFTLRPLHPEAAG